MLTQRPVVSVAATVAVIGVLAWAANALGGDRLPPAVGHAVSHAVVGIPIAVLLGVALTRWPPPRRVAPARLGRTVTVTGLAGIVVGQALEIVGARVDEPGASALEATAHTAGMIVSMLSVLAVAIGVILTLVATARASELPRWMVVAGTIVIIAAFWFVVFGAEF